MVKRPEASDTEELLRRAREGDAGARDALLARHRQRLCKMVTIRIDNRLRSRVDPSDVVQEAMRVAHRRLPEYLADPRRPFYPWLRGIALDRLVEMYRRHVVASKRSVRREEGCLSGVNNESEHELATRLVATSLHPSGRLMREEMLARVHTALEQLSVGDREVLVLRHLEQLSVEEIADVLNITRTNVTTRHLRALQRLRDLIGND